MGNLNFDYSRSGDILEVRLQDNSFRTYFKGKVNIRNKKKLRELIMTLKNKGVDFPKDII